MKKMLLFVGLVMSGVAMGQWKVLGDTSIFKFNNSISAMITTSKGNIIVGGVFTNANGKFYVAEWNGIKWEEVGGTNSSNFNGTIISIATDDSGNIYAAGTFKNLAGNYYVAKWDGVNWSELGGTNSSPFNDYIRKVHITSDNRIYVGGDFKNSLGYRYITYWDGLKWNEVGGVNSDGFNASIYDIFVDKNKNVYGGGKAYNNYSSGYIYLGRYNGVIWEKLYPSFDSTSLGDYLHGSINFIKTDVNENLYLSYNSGSIAKFDGANWSKLGGIQYKYTFSTTHDITVDFNGKVFLAGDYRGLGKYTYSTVPFFNGKNWAETFSPNQSKLYKSDLMVINKGKLYTTSNQIVYYTNPYPTLQGNIYLDNNSNSLQDTLEPYKSNVKVQLSNGNYTFTDNNGYYQIQADSIGSYTLTITPPTSYNALPASVTYNFLTYDTTVTRNIALQPTITKDSVAINVIPMVMNAVQGSPMPYWVQYDNAGTTVLSPTVSLTYNNYLLAYDSCTDINSTPTASGIVTSALNMQPGKRNEFISYFTVKPAANIGDTLITVYEISTPTLNVKDSFYMLIEGGVAAPNAQRATPSITPTQAAAGKDIVYTIGFKNTGNDTAYNVVITDTLSNLLQTNTLQMIASSHTCKATVKGNVATFEMLNIKLPKSTTNNLKSIGFASFKIKPKTTLVAGNIITNKANTYYNYRTPQSSVATTIVKNVLPVKITKYDVRFTNLSNETIENIWQTSIEINTSHFNIQRSADGRNFETVGKIAAKGNGAYRFIDELNTKDQLLKTYYYRLEIVDKDGSKDYSEIKKVVINNNKLAINIYPNPATALVTIDCKNAKQLLIIDYLGREVISKKVFDTQYSTININQLNKGVYIVKIVSTKGEIFTEKLIVE